MAIILLDLIMEVFSLIFQNKKPDYVFEITLDDKSESTFPMKDIFAKTACMFLKGVKIESLGTQIENFVIKKHFLPNIINNINPFIQK